MFALVVRFELEPAHAEAFDRLMAETVAALRVAEPGTLVYICCRVHDAPDARLFMEVYADRAAFEAHERAPATVRFLTARTPMIRSTRVEFLEPYELKATPLPQYVDSTSARSTSDRSTMP